MSKSSLLLLIIVIFCTFSSKQAYCSENYQDIKQQKIQPLVNNSFEFIENKGQLADSNGKPTPEILFYASTPGIHIYVRQEGISFILSKPVKNKVNAIMEKEAINNMPYDQVPEPSALEYYRTDMDFAGNVMKPVISGIEPTGAFNNYYLSQCPYGILNVRTFKGVTLENIYPNIDFVLYVNDSNQPEYDFVVKPGGNPDDIKLRIYPYQSLSLTENGSIKISTPLGDVEKLKPSAFQSEGNLKNEIMSRFVINTDGFLSFKIGAFDKQKTLTIDPMIRVWGTYFGGDREDNIYDMTIDPQKNLYMVGYTLSEDVIGVEGYQNKKGFGYDVFLTKFNTNGMRIWSTYYGGNGYDFGYAIEFYNNNIIIAGETISTSVMGIGGYQESPGKDSAYNRTLDAFLAEFDSNGQRQWGTFYGGNNIDAGFDLKVDKTGNIYLTGYTSSTDVMGAGGYQDSLGPGYDIYGERNYDAFIVKFNDNGTQREWGTYFGGNGIDIAYDIAVDSLQNIYLTGSSESTDIVGAGGYQSSKSLKSDAFIAKFNALGNKVWSTWYGGNDKDIANCMAIDKNGNTYIAGFTLSTDVFGNGGYQNMHAADNKENDVFLAKFNNNGKKIWGTFYGGNYRDIATDIKIDLNENIYFTGYSISTNIIGTGGYQQINGGNSDAFIAIFDSSGQRKYGTYYGGFNEDIASCIVVDSNVIYLAGQTASTDVIGVGGYQSIGCKNSVDGFIVKFANITQSIATNYSGSYSLCPGEHIRINYNKTGIFKNGNVFNAELSNSAGIFSSLLIIGSQPDTTLNYIDAIIPVGQTAGNNYRLRVVGTNPYVPGSANGNNIKINAKPPTPVIDYFSFSLFSNTSIGNQWYDANGPIAGATSKFYTPPTKGEYYVIVTVNGCSSDPSNKLYYKFGDIVENSKSSISNIYPNPFTDELIIEFKQPNENAEVLVLNMQGIEVIHSQLTNYLNTINTVSIPNGLYLLKVQTKDNVEILKVVKE